MRLTIVHERFTEYAGSEQVVEQLATEWPDAPVIAPIAAPGAMPEPLRARVRGTRLSRLLARDGTYAHLLPALPVAMRRLPLETPDAIIASHHAFASQVAWNTDVPVIAYVHSPARWVWDESMRAGEPGAPLLDAFAAAYRPADRRAADRLTTIVANSSAVARRIADWWEAPSRVVHPPVDTEFYCPDPSVPREDFYLVAGRLVPYKRPELAVRAAALADVPLIVAGDGRQRAQCEAAAGPRTQFLGRVSDEQLRSLFRRCKALVMPGVEDFGIVPVEAQACGAPVIAVDAGGSLDTVRPGVSGTLVPEGADSAEWAEVLRTFGDQHFDHDRIRDNAVPFSRARFRARMREVVEQTVGVAA